MQIDTIMPSAPRVTNPTATTASAADSTKPVSFASILEQEQAGKPEPVQAVKATAEEAATTEASESTPESAQATTESADASTLLATLLGTQVAAANTAQPQPPVVVMDGGETAPADPSATPVTDATAPGLLDEAPALTTKASTNAKASGFALPSEPATTVKASTEAQVEAVATPSVTMVATEAPEAVAATGPKPSVTTSQPPPMKEAAPAVILTQAVESAATTTAPATVQAMTTAATATAAPAATAVEAVTTAPATITVEAATTAPAAITVEAGTTVPVATTASEATAVPVATTVQAGTAAPAAMPAKVEAATEPQQGSTKPLEPVTETLLAETEAQVTPASANPSGKPQEWKAVAANTGKETGAAVKGAQPAEGATTATAVTATQETMESTFRETLATQAAQPEARSVKADKATEQTESSPAQGRQTATTPTLAVAHTDSTKQVERAQATANAQLPGNTPAAAQDPGAVVLKSIRFMTLQGEKSLTVKLHPESLGELVISIATKDGSLDVRLTASQPGTREIIEKQLGNLRDTLSREGLVVNRMSLTADPSGQQFQQASNRQAGADSSPLRPMPMPTGSAYRNELPAAISTPRTARHRGTLDIYA